MTIFRTSPLRIALWLLIAVTTLEVCARVEDRLRYGAPLLGDYSLDSLYGYDAIGKYGVPNAGYMKWQLNSYGYRGPDPQPGGFRIACIGSSETFGLAESPDMEWPRQLQAQLNSDGAPRFDVVNVAYAGMTVGTSLRRMPQVLDELHPQMAVIYPAYASYILDGTAQPWPQQLPPRGVLVRPRHIRLRIMGKVQTLFRETLPERAKLWMHWVSAKLALRGKGRGLDRLPQQNVDAFGTDLDHLVTLLQQNGVTVILVTHATRFGPAVQPEERSFLEDWRQYYPALSEDGFLDMEQRMRAAERAVAAAHHVPLVDAADQLAPGKQNFAEFVHFTDAGAGALAHLVATEIAEEQRNVPLPPAAR